MSIRDPLFSPRRSEAETVAACARMRAVNAIGAISDVYAHAIAARRVPAVADVDATDGPIGRFIRTGEVDGRAGLTVWRPLFGAAFGSFAEGDPIRTQAVALAAYLGRHAGRGPVDGWPCA